MAILHSFSNLQSKVLICKIQHIGQLDRIESKRPQHFMWEDKLMSRHSLFPDQFKYKLDAIFLILLQNCCKMLHKEFIFCVIFSTFVPYFPQTGMIV